MRTRPYSVREVADALGVSVKTVRKLIREGTLAAFRPGARAFKVKPEDLDDYIRRQERALRREHDERSALFDAHETDQRRDE
jgi:excisionase family DNA binding protein